MPKPRICLCHKVEPDVASGVQKVTIQLHKLTEVASKKIQILVRIFVRKKDQSFEWLYADGNPWIYRGEFPAKPLTHTFTPATGAFYSVVLLAWRPRKHPKKNQPHEILACTNGLHV